jgi:hypothetical protein
MAVEGNGWAQNDREELGVLRTRMSGVERALQDISASVAALATKFDKKSEIPWQALGVILAFVGLIGGALYWPIREKTTDLTAATVEINKGLVMASAAVNKSLYDLSEKTNTSIFLLSERITKDFVSVRELDARSARTQTDISRILQDINAIENAQVPRVEQLERMRSVDAQFGNIQRQVDDIKKSFGETFSLRDALQQMQRRIDQLETKRPS